MMASMVYDPVAAALDHQGIETAVYRRGHPARSCGGSPLTLTVSMRAKDDDIDACLLVLEMFAIWTCFGHCSLTSKTINKPTTDRTGLSKIR